jgi:hypothetical protein
MIRRLVFALLFMSLCVLNAQMVSIGNGNILHQGLPIEPLARFSYTQQLFYASEIGIAGEITHLGFQYNVQSNLFFAGNKDWKIYLGHSALNFMQNWVPAGELSLVFDGSLSQDWFDNSLPGSGWLTIPLQQGFLYDGVSNLILAVDENTDGTGSSSDDFFCREMSGIRALNFQSMSINPDPETPPATINYKHYLANLRLHFGGTQYSDAPRNLYAYYADQAVRLFWEAPVEGNPEAYLLHKDTQIISETTSTAYNDTNINAGQTYIYSVQARYPGGLLSAHSNFFSITVPVDGSEIILFESFENCPSFTQQIPGFQNLDLDGAPSWGWENLDFPSEGNVLGWLVFAPSQTTPPLTDISVPTGAKILMSSSATTPPNNDWLIFPSLHLGNSATLEFTARSFTTAYGLERLRVLISTTDSNPQSFSLLHAEDWLSLPASWTDYEFDLGVYANQDVYLALNAVSLDAFALFVDDIKVHGIGGHVDVQDQVPSALRPYPNPAQGEFSLKSQTCFDLKLYNLKGQRIASYQRIKDFNSAQLSLIPGIYILRVQQDGQQHTYRQIVLP